MDWTRGQVIGRGSTAAVSVATSRRSGDIFAVKSVELSLSEFLQREQKILSCLNYDHIVGYKGYDISKEENNKLMFNLMMEYVPSGTLSDAIRKHGGRIEEPMIRYYARQIVQGLEYLHSVGLVHCDIKGSNILLGEEGVKIADFGCAKWVNPVETATPLIGGTPMFMAPEVARGEEQGFPADIWALGCTIIEMATGVSPWPNAENPASLLYRIAYSGELPEFPEFLSCQARDFLQKCLKGDPKQRWTAKQLLKHQFLEEFEFPVEKQFEEATNSNSPTSILDQGIWNSMEEESETPYDMIQTNGRLDFAGGRVKELSRNSSNPNWDWDDGSWVTVRYNSKDEQDGNAVCGVMVMRQNNVFSGRGEIEDDEEVESSVGEESLSLSLVNDSFSDDTSHFLVSPTCTENRVVGTRNLSFDTHKYTMVLDQFQFL